MITCIKVKTDETRITIIVFSTDNIIYCLFGYEENTHTYKKRVAIDKFAHNIKTNM